MSITGSNNPFACNPVVFANANSIVSLGTITRDGNQFTFSVGFVWKINGVTYQNTAPVVLTIAEASEGFNRIDNALLNTSNTIELQQGLESETIALRPVAPETNIILTSWNISGSAIEDTETPILGNQFIEKSDFLVHNFVGSGSDVVIPLLANGASEIRLQSGLTPLTSIDGFDLSLITGNPDAKVPYNGKIFLIRNTTSAPITLKNSGDADFKFYSLSGTDVVIPVNGIITVKYGFGGGESSFTEYFRNWTEPIDLSGIKGIATQANAPTPYSPSTHPNGLFERYIVNTLITSPNSWGNIVVTQEELNANTVFFNVTNGVVSKELSVKPVADPAKLPLYSAIKSANIVAGTQFIDDENGNIVYRVKTGQTLLTTELPANVVGTKVERIGGADISTTPSPIGTNLSTGNIQTNKGIIYNTGGTVGADTNYDALILPLEKNTNYEIGGYVKNAGSSMGFYTYDGTTYTLLPNADLAYASWYNGVAKNLLLPADITSGTSSGIIKSPNKDGVYLIINTRYTTSNTAPTFTIKKVVATTLPAINSIKDVEFNDAVKNAFLQKSGFTTEAGKNLFNPEKVLKGWGNVYNNYTGINSDSNYNSVVIPLVKNQYYTVSGDNLATTGVLGAQNYSFNKLDAATGKYIPFTDAELSGYTRPDGVTTAKAWYKTVRSASTTILAPNTTEDVYLVLNTRFLAVNNLSTLQVEKATAPTSYEPYVEKMATNIFGYPLQTTQQSTSTSGGNQWSGKRIYFFGDSTMTTEVANNVKTNLTLLQALNYGSSGSDTLRLSQIVMGTNGYTKPDYTLCDAVVFYIGHNTETNGSVADVDGITPPTANTMWGNIGKAIEFIWSENANIKIYISTQHLTDRDAYARSANRAVILRDIAAWYSVPVIDVLKTSGINKKNLATYTTDNTHQNTAGAGRIAKAMSIGLMSN